MVGRSPLARLGRSISRDFCIWWRQLRVGLGSGQTRPGLYEYRFSEHGGQTRLHLRIGPDGAGLLFVDVSEVIHLNPMAAEITRMLLDGVRPRRIVALLQSWYPEAPPADVQADVAQLAEAVELLKDPAAPCAACALGFDRTEPFATRARAPYKADLALTYACQNNCAHCYNEPGRKQMASLETRDWRRVLKRLADIGVPHIIFTGGEPTLADGLPELVRCAEDLGEVTGINTNGRRLAEPHLAPRLKAAGLDHVQITLASHLPEVHNATVAAAAFDETVAGIRHCLQADLHTITNTTLTRENSDHALEIVEFLDDLGLQTFAMNGMICAGGGRHSPQSLSERELIPVLTAVRDRAVELGMRFLWYTPTEYCRLSPVELGLGVKSCNAAEYSICVEPNGDVLPCQSFYSPVGNLLKDDWSSIWNSELFVKLRTRRECPAEAGLPESCRDCPDLQVCGGGCPLQRAERYQEVLVHES